MTVITITARHLDQSQTREFTYHHSATTWLLLSGFLPLSEKPTQYLNPYTGEVADIQTYR